MWRTTILGLLLLMLFPANTTSAHCGVWRYNQTRDTWKYDSTICDKHEGYSDVVVVSDPPPRIRYYRYHRRHRHIRHDNSYRRHDRYYDRHPKTTKARQRHHDRVYHKDKKKQQRSKRRTHRRIR